MYKKFIYFLTIYGIFKNTLQCVPASFRNTQVYINGEIEKINDCISSDTLHNKRIIRQIAINHQNIAEMYKGAVQNITDRFKISFSNNTIDTVRSESFFNLPAVYEINLFFNQIGWLSENSFTHLPSLEVVQIQYNIIHMSARVFNDLPKLWYVNLDSNNLKKFDQTWFYKTPRLVKLSFQDNHLENLPRDLLTDLQQLTNIDFHKNEIEYIDKDAFKGLINLKKIDLSHNRIQKFNINFYTPSKLEFLDIGFNNITYLSKNLLQDVEPALRTLILKGNPWQCGCFDMFTAWGRENSISIRLSCLIRQELVCVYPKTQISECIERSGDDFQNGYWLKFKEETLCTQSV